MARSSSNVKSLVPAMNHVKFIARVIGTVTQVSPLKVTRGGVRQVEFIVKSEEKDIQKFVETEMSALFGGLKKWGTNHEGEEACSIGVETKKGMTKFSVLMTPAA